MMADKAKKFAITALISGAVGYVAGILTAPKSGKQTREDVKKAASKALTKGEKELKALHSELKQMLEKSENHLKKVPEKAKQGLKEAHLAAQKAQAKAKAILSA